MSKKIYSIHSRESKEEKGYDRFPKFEDLQVGHYLMDPLRNNTVIDVIALHENGKVNFYGPTGVRHAVMAHNLYGIPLSFDMMTLLGFTEIPSVENNKAFRFKMIDGDFTIEVYMANKISKNRNDEGNTHHRSNKYFTLVNGVLVPGCDKVHKLQTLFNGLTGKKLKFTIHNEKR